METDVETPAQEEVAPMGAELPKHPEPPVVTPIRYSQGWRRWFLRGFVLLLLLAAAGTVTAAALTIAGAGNGSASDRQAINGVLMPNDSQFRDVARQLLARKKPEKLRGMTIVGAGGKVTVLRYQAGAPSFLSSYLNPNALPVIARAIGVRSDEDITVDELRLEVLRRTGRQRWRLRGTQGGRLWRATINPNGTNLRLVPVKAS
ncbi:MAG: hypothetical protein JWM31_1561 [Solirubrobacterales bacterium]|nr:hypothetical protein [Solirubrobacterales bacterium]